MSDGPSGRNSSVAGKGASTRSLRHRIAKVLFSFDPEAVHRRAEEHAAAIAGMGRSLEEISGTVQELQRELESLRDRRVPALERRTDAAEEAIRLDQAEVERLRDERIVAAERRMDTLARQLEEAVRELGQLRDERLPAAVARQDVLVERLASGHEELASLVERILRDEPLPVPESSSAERDLAIALRSIQPALLEEFRGGEEEIAHRMERYIPLLEGKAPVLDLGCGRGELLLLLREAGIEAEGVEDDPALAAAARRRGLVVRQEDVLSALRREEDASLGAVTAIHLLEHLEPSVLLAVLAEVRRVLAQDGVFVAECPNPHSLRVGATLFWLDPTHLRPLLPETLALFLRASGFSVEHTEYLHPFPQDQALTAGGVSNVEGEDLARRLARLEDRLDAIVNGHRDFLLVARKEPAPGADGERN